MSQPKEPGMRAKHTAGPWKIYRLNWGFQVVPSSGPHRVIVALPNESKKCGRGHQEKINFENEANAHLISAAPELLKACKIASEVLQAYGHRDNGALEAWSIVIDAIQKAEGA